MAKQWNTSNWSIDAARDTYAMAHWGDGYVDVGGAGDIVIRPPGPVPAWYRGARAR